MIIADSRLVSAEQETFSWVETTLIVKLTCQDSLAGAEVLARWGNMLLPLFSFSYTRCILCSGYLCFQLFCRYKFSNNFFSRSLGVSQHSNVVHLGACLSIILILLDCRIIETRGGRNTITTMLTNEWKIVHFDIFNRSKIKDLWITIWRVKWIKSILDLPGASKTLYLSKSAGIGIVFHQPHQAWFLQ